LSLSFLQVDCAGALEPGDRLICTRVVCGSDEHEAASTEAFIDRAPILIGHEHLFNMCPEATVARGCFCGTVARALVDDGYLVSIYAQVQETVPRRLCGIPGFKHSNNLSRIHIDHQCSKVALPAKNICSADRFISE